MASQILFILLGLVFVKFAEQCDILMRPAGGHAALIGEFFDSRTASFVGASIFQKDYIGLYPAANDSEDNTAVEWKSAASTDIDFGYSKNYIDRFDNLGVSATVKLDVLAGRIKLEGSSAYAHDNTNERKKQASYIKYNIVTKKQNINWHDKKLENGKYLTRNFMAVQNNTFATHVVAGILWGANTIISCDYEEKGELQDKKYFDGNLKLIVRDMSFNVTGKATTNYKNVVNSSFLDLEVQVYGDILPIDGSVPMTFDEAFELIKMMPVLLGNVNSGWGVPLYYELHPLESLPSYLQKSKEKDLLRSLDGGATNAMMRLFEDFAEVKSKLNDLYRKITENKQYVRPEDDVEVSDFLDEVTVAEVVVRSNITMMMTKQKVGELTTIQVFEMIDNLTESNYSLMNVDKKLKDWARIEHKIDLAHEFVGNGSTYLGLGTSYEESVVTVPMSYVLLFKEELMKANETRWGGNKVMFLEQLEADKGTDSGTAFFAVDCDLQDCGELNTTYLQLYRADKLIESDVLENIKAADCGVNITSLDHWRLAEDFMLNLTRYYENNHTTLLGYKEGDHYVKAG